MYPSSPFSLPLSSPFSPFPQGGGISCKEGVCEGCGDVCSNLLVWKDDTTVNGWLATGIHRFSCTLEQQSTAEYTFGKGRALWEMPGSDKKQAYSSFLQVWLIPRLLLLQFHINQHHFFLSLTGVCLLRFSACPSPSFSSFPPIPSLPPSQAAKADPFHSDIFLYLGHYQKLITKDLK